MKKRTIGQILAVTFMPLTVVNANETGASDDNCNYSYELAHSVMEARQLGVPLPNLVKIADGNELMLALIEEAYSKPKYASEDYKTMKANDFANDVYLICMQHQKASLD
ncbi:MAG: hypothetical protein EP324_08175 [Gammaproteobacteria bacterium]|nr:MAG: hypothetical protein EP324_08175 [Gammaproteobacteria bacterium]